MGAAQTLGRRCMGAAGIVCLAFTGGGFVRDAVAQSDAAEEKKVRIVRTTTPPVIDGKVDDAVWATAALIDDFHQVRPTDGGAPSERTEVRLLYDDDYLYSAARMYDSEPDKVTRNVMRHG